MSHLGLRRNYRKEGKEIWLYCLDRCSVNIYIFLGHQFGLENYESDNDDEEMKLLRRSLPYMIKNGVANSTFNKYKSSWDKWLVWSSSKNITGRPAEPYYIAMYLNHLFFVNKNKGCITAALYAVRWGHHVVGLPSPTDSPLTKLAYEGALRMCGGERVRKDAMPLDTLKEVITKYCSGSSTLMDLRFITVCLIGFAGFMRIEELLSTQLKNVTISPDHLKIFLPRSKSDQHRQGNEVLIAKTGTKFCPVGHVKKFLQEAKLDIHDNPEAYLIPKLHKTKRAHNASKTKGVSYTTIREHFSKNMDTVRKIDENFGLHSLRSGGASSAAQHGVSDRLISKQGRWASEKARNGYIKDDKKTRLSVSRSLGL